MAKWIHSKSSEITFHKLQPAIFWTVHFHLINFWPKLDINLTECLPVYLFHNSISCFNSFFRRTVGRILKFFSLNPYVPQGESSIRISALQDQLFRRSYGTSKHTNSLISYCFKGRIMQSFGLSLNDGIIIQGSNPPCSLNSKILQFGCG